MRELQKTAGIASLVNAFISAANVLVVLGALGTKMVSEPRLMAELVRTNPFPIVVLELLKILSAICGLFVVFGIHRRLKKNSYRITKVATLAGIASILLLLTAGVLGLIAIAVANRAEGAAQSFGIPAYLIYSAIINRLGLGAVFANGIWYLLVSVTGRSKGLLPPKLGYVGVPLGVASLIAFVLPAIAILVLVLSLMWSIWLGIFLLCTGLPKRISQTNTLEVFK
jgi:hypothetical protein